MQQCCDHPYLVDQMLQNSLTKGHPVTDILDIGVRSCGKLLLLDKMLQMIRTEGLRVLILIQVRHPWYYASIIFFYLHYLLLVQFIHVDSSKEQFTST